jgi:protein-disulfide isomerase
MNSYRMMKYAANVLLFFSFGYAVPAQDSELNIKKEIEELKKGQNDIRKELVDIKTILSKTITQKITQINFKGVEFDLSAIPIRKNSDMAKLVIIEFTDYQCPYCGRYVRETFPRISEQYIEKGLVRYAIIDLPLPTHKMAAKAAEAPYCAGDQGKYWEMHKLIMSNQESISDLSSYAITLILDIAKYENCLESNMYKDQIDKQMNTALKYGLSGVPTFVIATIDSNNATKARGVSMISGARPFSDYQKEIDQALSEVSP